MYFPILPFPFASFCAILEVYVPSHIKEERMVNRMRKKRLFMGVLALLLAVLCTLRPIPALADVPDGSRQYYLGTTIYTGMDNGYSGSFAITQGDPHFGWSLGRFFVTGYTSDTTDDAGNPVFLKTVGDKVTLWFHLEQDISKLNGNEDLSISNDYNGYDQYFGVTQAGFGKGTLIIRHTDYRNLASDPVIYTDFLVANATQGVDTTVELFEEGDYEVALNYEIREEHFLFPSYTNYRIFFRFSVRNGNCMVFPFDSVTGEELTNTAITENGFYLDLAKSRYLDINLRREVLAEGAQGLTEDTRFNRPAREGEHYTQEGIYTITVRNRYTGEDTVKVIYVGTDDVLKAHVTTGLPISEITWQLSAGATVAEDGTIIPPPTETEPPAPTSKGLPQASTAPAPTEEQEQPTEKEPFPILWVWVGVAGAGALILLVLLIRHRILYPRVKAHFKR